MSKKPLHVFISYAHEDDVIREKLCVHLSPLIKDGLIKSWNDREITAGTDWVGAIDDGLESADIILLLISADFINSNYCYDVEMKRALERHKAGTACVIPVIVRPCDWKGLPFGKLNALPQNGKPIQAANNLDRALTQVSQEIRRIAGDLQDVKPQKNRLKGPLKDSDKIHISLEFELSKKLLGLLGFTVIVTLFFLFLSR